MAFSDWWEDFTNQSIPKASKSLSIRKHHSLGMSTGNVGQLGGANVITSNNIPQGQAIYINPQTGAAIQQGITSYHNGSSWTTAAGTATTGTWPDEGWDNQPSLIDDISELLISLGFIENLVEHTYELDLKTKIRIPIGKISHQSKSQAQITIGQYLDEIKKKIIEQITNKIIINKLTDIDKKNKSIKLC